MIAALLLIGGAIIPVDSVADCRAVLRASLGRVAATVEAVNTAQRPLRDSAIRFAGRTARDEERIIGQRCTPRSRPSLLQWVRMQGVLRTITTTTTSLGAEAPYNSTLETLYVVQKAKPTDDAIAFLRKEANPKDVMPKQTDEMVASIARCGNTSHAKLSLETRTAVEECVGRAVRALASADQQYREREMAYLKLIEAQLRRFEKNTTDSASLIVRSRAAPFGVPIASVKVDTSSDTFHREDEQWSSEFWLDIQSEIRILIGELRDPIVQTGCSISGLSISPTLSLVDATTRVKNLSGDLHLLDSSIQSTECGSLRRFDLIAGGKYDEKTKEGGAPNITRHYTARAQELWQPSATSSYLSLTGNFLSDNSLALYLQQTYTASLGRLIQRGTLAMEGSIGVAGVGQHFTTIDTSRTFAALALGLRLNYVFTSGGLATAPGSLPPEVSFGSNGVFGSGRTLATAQLALKVPTLVRSLSLTVKSWLDYVSNTPTGFKNHYWSIEIGPQLKIGTIP